DRPIVIVADPGREQEAAVRLGRIGFDHVTGFLNEGLRSIEARPELTSTTERISPAVAADRIANGGALLVDLRGPRERDQKYIAGSLSVPLNHLAERVAELSADRPLVLHCAGGYLSSIGASVLQQLGFSRISEMAGGITAWETAALPLAHP